MKIVTTCSRSGGTGKTTIATNCADWTASRGGRGLLLDLDPQGDASRLIGGTDSGEMLADALLGKRRLEDVIRPSRCPGVDLIPAGEMVERALDRVRPAAISEALEGLPQGRYSVVVIDSPPRLAEGLRAAWLASHRILVPIDGPDAFRAVVRLQRALEDAEIPGEKLRVVLNRHDPRRVLDRELVELARERFGPSLLRASIRETVRVRESAANRQVLRQFAPDHGVTADLSALAEEVLHG